MTELPPRKPASTAAEIRRLVERSEVTPTPPLTPWEKLQHDDYRLMIDLRKTYARRVLWGLGVELGVANVVFVLYASIGVHWRIPAQTMDVWLGATVVQVVGIVHVVTRHLFPGRPSA